MNLAERLGGAFSATTKSRGHEYFSRGAVRVEQGSSDELEARVSGTQKYNVSFTYLDGVLLADCECEYFYSGNPCKHLWATILMADMRGYLSQAALDPELELDFGDDEIYPVNAGIEGAPSEIGPGAYLPGSSPGKTSWKKQLESIAMLHSWALPASAEWPANRELLYIVDVLLGLDCGGLVVALGSRAQKADGTWSRCRQAAPSPALIGRLPRPEDRAIMSSLAGAMPSDKDGSIDYDSYEGHGFYRIMPPVADSTVRQMAGTGRCFLRLNSNTVHLI